MTSTEALLRAGKLFKVIIDYAATSADAFKLVVQGFGDKLFAAPLVHCASNDREIAAAFLNATGIALGARDLPTLAEDLDLETVVDEQKEAYVLAVKKFIAEMTADATAAPAMEQENGIDALPKPSPTQPLGYIPTVVGIDSSLAAAASAASTASDQQLVGVLTGLSAFLSRDDNRVAFCQGKSVDSLLALLGKEVGLPIQVYYQSVFCLWLLSFSGQHDPDSKTAAVVGQAMKESFVGRKLTNVIREISAEKVIRISLSTLRNLMNMGVAIRKDMVSANLVQVLESLLRQNWDDEDITEDLDVLVEALAAEHASMSTFDVYKAEVLSGALEWSPAHRDEMFWQNNVEKLESNNLEVLRCIVRVLNESSDSTVLSVACHDLAQFVKYHKRGRQIAQSLRVKARLMELMATGDSEVRRYALNGVQVLMITHWNLMQRSS